MANLVRIGCGGGFWGDSEGGPAQLVNAGGIDFLIVDYLAEITMSLLARARQKTSTAGYVPDFVAQFGRTLSRDIAAKRIRVVVNAGGVNPFGCRDALLAELAKADVDLQVAVVLGDDLMPMAGELRSAGVNEMASGAPLPPTLWSANAYLGAFPIAAALDAGADVVITGRCTDSALALGPLIHAFKWSAQDFDRLAMGSLAGHIIECGTQATGGLSTDWEQVPGWDDMGFPIAECQADGSFVITKPAGTGGLVTVQTVAEQIVYEIGDPARYVLPDVVCDFSEVRLEQAGKDRVRVTGARGLPPTSTYKVSATYPDGFKASGTMMIGGRDAAAKARRTAEAILARARRMIAARGLPDFRRTSVEVLGAEDTYGANRRADGAREVILKIAVHSDSRDSAEVFSREFLPSATAMAQGITGFAAGRPKVAPLVRLFSFVLEKERVRQTVLLGDSETEIAAFIPTKHAATTTTQADPIPVLQQGARATVPLIALAYGRSGDKGDIANIGILARRPEFVPVLAAALTPAAVKAYFTHIVTGPVERFPIPGLHGFNFLLHGALDGGGVASLRYDPQGKAFAQMLLDCPVQVPVAWVEPGGMLAEFGRAA